MRSEQRIHNNRLRRQRELRRHVLLFALTACLALGLSVFAGSFLSRAKDSQTPVSYKYYTSITVKEGETLLSIAGEHMDSQYASAEEYVKEVIRINALSDSDYIPAGALLRIPYHSTEFVE